MRVLLTMPLFIRTNKEDQPPLGLAYLAAVLLEKGHDVKVLDPNVEDLNPEQYLKIIKQYNPDVIGMPCTTDFRFPTFKTAGIIKNEFPEIPLVMGGNHVTYVDVDTLNMVKSVDFIVRGEGEITLSELVENLEKKQFDQIRGLTYRAPDGRVIRNPDRPLIEDLDSLPFPAREVLPFSKYQGLIEVSFDRKMTPVVGSRGCPMPCVFCSGIFGKRCRTRSVKSLFEEMKFLYDRYNFKAFNIWDDIFTLNKKRAIDLSKEIIKERMDVEFFCNGHVLSIDDEMLSVMKKAGCKVLDLGIESGSDRILKVIKKGITIDQAKKAILMTLKNDISVNPGMMFNHPTETLYDVGLTLRFRKYMFELNKKYKAGIYPKSGGVMSTIYPGTELERLAKEEGIIPKNFNWSAPYYNERNLIWGEYPYVPIYEHIPLDQFVNFYIKESIRIGHPYELITVMYRQMLGLKKGLKLRRGIDIVKNELACLRGIITEFDKKDYEYASEELKVLIRRRGLSIIK